MKKNIVLLVFIIGWGVVGCATFPSRAVKKIKEVEYKLVEVDPKEVFEDERKNWIGMENKFTMSDNVYGWGDGKKYITNGGPMKLTGYFTNLYKQEVTNIYYWKFKPMYELIHIDTYDSHEYLISKNIKHLLIKDNSVEYYFDLNSKYIIDANKHAKKIIKLIGKYVWAKDKAKHFNENDNIFDDFAETRFNNLEKLKVIDFKDVKNTFSDDDQLFTTIIILEKNDGSRIKYNGNCTMCFFEDFYVYSPYKMEKYKSYSKDIWNLIRKRKIRLGITSEQAKLSWGEPPKINRTVGAWGVKEQWVYRNNYSEQYLYFENGTLTSWQD